MNLFPPDTAAKTGFMYRPIIGMWKNFILYIAFQSFSSSHSSTKNRDLISVKRPKINKHQSTGNAKRIFEWEQELFSALLIDNKVIHQFI